MNLLVLGVNHETAPLAVRERLAFSPDELQAALPGLVAQPGVSEAAIISTCNRTELYVNARDPRSLLDWYAASRGRQADEMGQYLYVHSGEEAARHTFRVAAGLDSMVLGETQILGQMKDAERLARETGSLGVLLNGLFQRAFQVAKDVRSRTQIGSASVSMAAAGVRLAERIFPSVADCSVLFVGAGEMIELCATYFCAQKPRKVAVANRTMERGQKLAAEHGGEAMLLTEIHARLHEFDIIVTSTASPLPVIGKGMIEHAIKQRKRRPLFIVDLAVPRDVEPEAAALADVYLYTVDDLHEVVRQGVESRQGEVVAAESLITEHVGEFAHWLSSRELVPTIRDLRDHTERTARNELARARKRLAAGENPDEVLEKLTAQLSAKFLHAPLASLNAASGEEQAALVAATRRLFRLHDEE